MGMMAKFRDWMERKHREATQRRITEMAEKIAREPDHPARSIMERELENLLGDLRRINARDRMP